MILAVIVFGFLLRVISLNQSFWLDEATSGLVVRSFNLGEIITKFSPGDFHPPFYYLVLKIWSYIFSTNEIALRFPSIVFGLLTVYLVYLIGKKLFSSKVGLIAGALLATSGLHIYYSQEARMYSLTAFLVSFLIYLFLKKKWLIFSIILMLVGLTDYPALLIIPVFWILAKKDWKKLSVSHIPLLFSFLLWLPIFVKQLSGGLSVNTNSPDWWKLLGQTSVKNVALIPVKFILGRISFDNKYLYAVAVGTISVIIVYLLIKSLKEFKKTNILWYWLIIPIILAAIVGFKISVLSYFRLLFCLPAFYLLMAVGISKIPKYANYLLGILLISNLVFSGIYLFSPRFQREDWRSVAGVLGDSKIVFPANSQKEALTYYGKKDQIISPNEINNKYKEIYLSRYVWEIFDPSDSARQKIESLEYNKIGEYNFNGVVIYKYAHSN